MAAMAVTAGLALATLGACTTAGSSADTASDPKSVAAGGDTTVSPLPPGKYKTLPQPCTAVDLDTLKGLVPGAKDYAGAESLTYDTDRRVGCSWHTDAVAGAASRTLSVDFERAVSYDPNVSDEVQAETDFERRAANASIPPVAPGSTPTTPASPTATATGTDPSTGQSAGTGSDGSSPDLLPRRLTDLGNGGFINDVLKTSANGPKRSVTVVFRTANVVVSVTYAATEPRGSAPATSADLQKGARDVAGELERKVEG
ncbi:hypothetical protein SAMN05216267_1018157 [Actinacidiphila rubida]|uniref:DUF3558 domain-containing protein n=1 Tax=Actinacidiphila rubida TaxID=310780 RepID=A0A1H8MDX4_9ACTN|nr:hypothetical protein SAMN05216267_1018157 [Actinacidiphila rubida]